MRQAAWKAKSEQESIVQEGKVLAGANSASPSFQDEEKQAASVEVEPERSQQEVACDQTASVHVEVGS